MNFNSPEFLLFLIGVVAVNYCLPQRFRSVFLLFASMVFIGYYNFESLLTVLISSAFNFYISRRVSGNRLLYVSGVILNSYAIIMFNYFFAAKHGFDFSYTVITFNINSFIIALGLSFYSLQNISYLTEVYFKRWQPEFSIKNYVLYNAFFPRIMSGPVMTPKEFMPQIDTNPISSDKLISGLNRFLLGLVKKMVIADRLAPAVHSVFDFGDTYSGLTTLVGVYLFTIQLYFDFSGYTDMAIGIGKMLGYDLKENFNFPLRSSSVSEFWRRWHFSLISWFTNYIYYPLVYKLRVYKKAAALTGILVTFLVSGIWHGIGYTFLLWALCHIVYLSFELLTKKIRGRVSEKYKSRFFKFIFIFLVFNAVCFSNIFFRSQSLARAFHVIKGVFNDFIPEGRIDLVAPLAIGGHQIDEFNFYISILLMTIFLLFERKISRLGSGRTLNATYIVVCFLLLFLFGIINSGERFIYMQF